MAGATNGFITKLNATGTALIYSTYLGGTSQDQATAIAVDSSGNAYVTGLTESSDFPITPGAFQTSYSTSEDSAFVTKLNATGTTLIYSTFLGGNFSDSGRGIALDSSGYAYVVGVAASPNFPTTPGAFQTTLGGTSSGFITKLNPTGSTLVYSTYLGGSNSADSNSPDQAAIGIAVDSTGNAHVAGNTRCTDFPTTAGAFQTTYGGGDGDAFVTELNASGSALIYSTFLGGTAVDDGFAIALDSADDTYVVGLTQSANFPIVNAFQPSLNGAVNAYVTELNPSGSALVYSSYLGGSGNDAGLGIALDSSANAYVTGNTSSSDFPTTVGALQTNLTGSSNAFVSKIACAGPGVWTQEALIPTLDSNYSAATVNGIVYAQGGCCSNSPTNNESYAYDPSTNTWSAEATQPITAFDPQYRCRRQRNHLPHRRQCQRFLHQ